MSFDTLIFVGLTMIAVGGIFYAFAYPYLSGETKVEKRKAAIQGDPTKRVVDAGRDVAQRRKQIVDSLKELDARGKSKKLTLDTKIGQAGLNWSKGKFFAFSACCAVIVRLDSADLEWPSFVFRTRCFDRRPRCPTLDSFFS